MNTFTRKSLYAALAGVGALGVTGAAQAVNVNPNGLGQVLLYPYYTVRTDNLGNPYNSLLSVVNSTASVKAVKVRFVEGKNSAEVIDFNLFLSPFDVWTAAIVPDPTLLLSAGTPATTTGVPTWLLLEVIGAKAIAIDLSPPRFGLLTPPMAAI